MVNEEPEVKGAGEVEPEERDAFSLADDAEEDLLEQAAPSLEILSFHAGEEEYAFNVMEIREIIRQEKITAIPRCPDYILGIISLRGEIVPVIDLKRRLDLKGGGQTAEEPMIVVIQHGEESAGFLVERVSGIVRVEEREVEPPPEVISPDKAEFLEGVVRSQEGLVAILKVEKLLDVAQDFER